MKISRLALCATIASACVSGTAFGQTNRTAPRYEKASYYSYYDEGSAAAPAAAAPSNAVTTASANCDNGSAPCDLGDSCDANGCDSLGCGSTGLFGMGLIGTGRSLTDPWKLCSEPVAGFTIGGWSDLGYFSRANPLSFNNYAPGAVRAHR